MLILTEQLHVTVNTVNPFPVLVTFKATNHFGVIPTAPVAPTRR